MEKQMKSEFEELKEAVQIISEQADKILKFYNEMYQEWVRTKFVWSVSVNQKERLLEALEAFKKRYSLLKRSNAPPEEIDRFITECFTPPEEEEGMGLNEILEKSGIVEKMIEKVATWEYKPDKGE